MGYRNSVSIEILFLFIDKDLCKIFSIPDRGLSGAEGQGGSNSKTSEGLSGLTKHTVLEPGV
jgi:hypothetical protein